MQWNNEADTLLRTLWEAGGTLSSISRDMADHGYVFSRNSISGRKWRLEKIKPFDNAARPRTRAMFVKRRKPRMLVVNHAAPKPKRQHVEPQDGIDYTANDFGCKAILEKIGSDGLRMCCGKKRCEDFTGSLSSYCPTHHRLYNHYTAGARVIKNG